MKEASLIKAINIPTIWYSWKGKTLKTVKRSLVARGRGQQWDESTEHRRVLGQWNYYVSLCIFKDPQNVHHQW